MIYPATIVLCLAIGMIVMYGHRQTELHERAERFLRLRAERRKAM